jgi:hypothetical protein
MHSVYEYNVFRQDVVEKQKTSQTTDRNPVSAVQNKANQSSSYAIANQFFIQAKPIYSSFIWSLSYIYVFHLQNLPLARTLAARSGPSKRLETCYKLISILSTQIDRL